MITSKDNEKLKLIRKLAERKHREREGLFVAEGEDLVEAAAEAAGGRAEFVLGAGEDVEPELLDAVIALGSGTRVIGVYRRPEPAPGRRLCVYLHGVGDPGNVGAIVRTAARAARTRRWCSARAAPTRTSPKAVRASMGSIFARPPARRVTPTLAARRSSAWSPTAARRPTTSRSAALCSARERDGLPGGGRSRGCDRLWTIPLREGARIAQRRRGGGDRPGTDIVGRLMRENGSTACARRPRRRSPTRRATRRARGAAGPLPRPQVGADLDPARDRRAPARPSAGRSARRRTRRARRSRPSSTRGASELEAAELERSLAADAIDVTLPGAPPAPSAARRTC